MKVLNIFIWLACFAPCFILAQKTGEVILYNDAGYKGSSITFSLNGAKDRLIPLVSAEGFSNDALSSIKVGKGVMVNLWDDKGCRADQQPLKLYEGGTPSLLKWNDVISSLSLTKIEEDVPISRFYSFNSTAADNPVQSLGPGTYMADNLLDHDGISKLTATPSSIVTVYIDDHNQGRSRDFTSVDNENLEKWDFHDNISSLKILRIGFRLTKMEFGPGRVITQDNAQNIGGEGEAYNDSKIATIKPSITATAEYSSQVTSSWNNAISAGVTMTVTSRAGVEVAGLGKAETELSLAATLQNTFTFGKETTESKTTSITNSMEIEIPPLGRVKYYLAAVPVEKEYDVTYTFVPDLGKNADGTYIDYKSGNLSTYITTEKVTMKMATKAIILTKDIDDMAATPVTSSTSPSVNVALGKKATASSEVYGGSASRAVDGSTKGKWDENSTTHTSDENNPWWEVDLGDTYQISKINIWNRRDECCWSRMQNFYVMVSENPIAGNSTTQNLFDGEPHSFTSPNDPSMILEGNKRGRYVRIFIQGNTKVLSVAEIEVFGSK